MTPLATTEEIEMARRLAYVLTTAELRLGLACRFSRDDTRSLDGRIGGVLAAASRHPVIDRESYAVLHALWRGGQQRAEAA